MTDFENMNEEFVVSSQRSNKRPWLFLLLLVMIAAITTLSIISDSWLNNQRIKKIKIFGCRMVSEDELTAVLKDSVKNTKIMNVSYSEIAKLVKQNNIIEEVNFNALFNGELHVFVTERIPIAVAINITGDQILVDSNGVVFNYFTDQNHFDYPVIRGSFNSESFRGAAKLLNKILQTEQSYYHFISEIMPGRGIKTYEIITSDYGYRLIVDSDSDIKEQLPKYNMFLTSSICANESYKVDYIDLRWEKRLVIGRAA